MRLGFYINPVARYRDPESPAIPEPAVISALAVSFGVQAIVAGFIPSGHLMTERDLKLMRELIHTDLIILTPLGEEFVEPVIKLNPEGVILVASGWDGMRDFRHVQMEIDSEIIASAVSSYRAAGVQTAALIEPDASVIKTVARCGLSGVVLDTLHYSCAASDEEAETALNKIEDCALAAHKFGLVTSAGHGLNYQNVGPIIDLQHIEELFIGRSIVARAVMTGIDRAVGEMIRIIDRHRRC